jgi:hypothetical protein
MTGKSLSTDAPGLNTEALNHSREFVELVARQAPGEYRALLASERFGADLAADNNFNFGQLYAYAEFAVFRREFRRRFPQASTASCINAFSKLFLKNDISISNLVEYMESPAGATQPRLE